MRLYRSVVEFNQVLRARKSKASDRLEESSARLECDTFFFTSSRSFKAAAARVVCNKTKFMFNNHIRVSHVI